jgi:AraC-like DNA-binding protein
MPNTLLSDCQLGRHLASQYGIDTVQSFVSKSRRGSELGVARMRYELPHLFVLAPLPTEDAFLLSVEINSGGSRRIVRDGESRQLGLQQEGAFHIADLSQRTSAYVSSPFHSMFFHLSRATLNAFAEEMEIPRVERLRCDAGTLDPVIANLGRAMLPVLMRPQDGSRLFMDHMALALKAHVIHVYGDVKTASVRAQGLAPWQESRAKAFLIQHLAGNVSLADVARECALSRSHFSKAFKQTTGRAPHAWLVAQRIEAAQRLLRDPTLSIAQVAVACGFSDQSHLTRVFPVHTGTSPARWRRLNAS